MKKIIVPKYLRKKALFRILKRLPIFILVMWMVDCVVEYISLSIYTASGNNIGNISTVFAFLYCIPFLVSGIPLKLIDSDWYGEIILFDVKNNKKNSAGDGAGITQEAMIELPNGKLKTVKIYDEGELFYGNREKVYNVHDKVIHVYGMDYLMPVRTLHKELPTVCVVCGCKNPCEDKVCKDCGAPLDIVLADKKKG